ncbi:MAG: pantoate--beta-alanine ligase [Myxococcaceae bacterium]|nr:pantoate--beta-alanine ligase [Myxococcaceae bacterium]
MPVQTVRTTAEMQQRSEALRMSGKRIALVPTMGFLHEGHLSLMREAKARADVVVVSIFVNPTQFGPKEDLSRYPRDLEGDLSKCESVGVDVVFAPADPKEMYPDGYQTWVEVTDVSKGLCGEKRPGHFRGVATVVAKLFNIVRPYLALFGEKDYQQLQVIKALARDLNFGIEIVGMPTVRDPDGLAMSSRNAYLSPSERERALALSRGLRTAHHLARNGVREVRELVQAVRKELEAAQVREDYVEVVDAETLRSLTTIEPGRPARVLVAGFLGTTRLIDNLAL